MQPLRFPPLPIGRSPRINGPDIYTRLAERYGAPRALIKDLVHLLAYSGGIKEEDRWDLMCQRCEIYGLYPVQPAPAPKEHDGPQELRTCAWCLELVPENDEGHPVPEDQQVEGGLNLVCTHCHTVERIRF